MHAFSAVELLGYVVLHLSMDTASRPYQLLHKKDIQETSAICKHLHHNDYMI